ncbi:MAG TPA: hypothetical protein VGB28_00815 [Actinomycetota bacterium]
MASLSIVEERCPAAMTEGSTTVACPDDRQVTMIVSGNRPEGDARSAAHALTVTVLARLIG